MEHLEVAGATPEAPGTDGLTINNLPDEMLMYIFSMMDINSLLLVTKVCTRWQQLCMTPYIWQNTYLIIKTRNFRHICRNILPLFGKCLKNVQLYYLNISNASKFRASCVRYCPHLTHLQIETEELDSSILDDLRHWPDLKFLSFNIRGDRYPLYNARNSDHNLSYVAKNVKTLKLKCRSSSLDATQFRTSLIRHCPNLIDFEINAWVDRSIFDDLHHLPNLKFLSFCGTTIVDKISYSVANHNSGSGYNLPFEKLKYLETLILPSFKLTRDSLYSMLDCEDLVSINMENMRDIPADFLESLLRTKQTTLRALYIYGDTLTDDLMRHITKCKQLRVLHIVKCDTLSDSSLQLLSNLNYLH